MLQGIFYNERYRHPLNLCVNRMQQFYMQGGHLNETGSRNLLPDPALILMLPVCCLLSKSAVSVNT